MSDTEIRGTVQRTLATMLDDPDMIHVEVEQGVVYLEGIARSAAQKQRIDQALRLVPGVRQVVNCLSLEHLADLPTDPDCPEFLPIVPNIDRPAGQYKGFSAS